MTSWFAVQIWPVHQHVPSRSCWTHAAAHACSRLCHGSAILRITACLLSVRKFAWPSLMMPHGRLNPSYGLLVHCEEAIPGKLTCLTPFLQSSRASRHPCKAHMPRAIPARLTCLTPFLQGSRALDCGSGWVRSPTRLLVVHLHF